MTRFKQLPIALVLFLSLILGAASQADAQALPGTSGTQTAEPAMPDPLTPEAVHEMVARMSDDQVRQMLLDRLDAVAAAETEVDQPPSLFARVQTYWLGFKTSVVGAVVALPRMASTEAQAISTFAAGFGPTGLLSMFGYVVLTLALGFAAEFLTNQFTRKWQGAELAPDNTNLTAALRYLFRRFVREMLGLVVFFLVATTVGRALLTAQQLEFAGPFVTYLIWLPRLGAAVSRFVLAPNRPKLRLVNVSDRWAKYLYRNLIGLVVLGGFTIFIVNFNEVNGVAADETRIGFWFDTAVYIYIIIMALQAREGLVQMMLGADPDTTEFDRKIANNYPRFAIIVAALTWVLVNILVGLDQVTSLLQGAHYKTMFWLLMAPALDTLIRGLTRHLQPPMIGQGPIAEAAYESTKRGYIRIGRVVAGAFVVIMIANAWNIDLRNLAAAGVGQSFAGNLIEAILILAIGYVAYEAASLWVNRKLAKEQTAVTEVDSEAGGEGGGAGGSRLVTVLPLLLMTVQVAIIVLVGLLALGALGLDITPLLAGAGIMGLAIGFGAQKLVTDIVSGAFFLIDDAFRVGEYVEIDGTMGTVEKISIRSMQLRHHRGLVHTIPYGEIPKLTNFSRDWVIMKLMFTVPFDTDPNKVKKIFKKIGNEMMEDPAFKDGFLEPFKSQGVLNFDDVGMVIRGKFMAKPGAQFTIRKEIYNRVKKEFSENGIEFARREVRVNIPGLEDADHLSEEEKAAVAAAAGTAVQQQIDAAKADEK